MKLKKVAYWFTTIFVTLILGISGAMSIAHAAPLMKALKHLGYPDYFANILGVGKVIGLAVFLAPGMPRFKEWAYAGVHHHDPECLLFAFLLGGPASCIGAVAHLRSSCWLLFHEI
jgi:hypothetical protein